MIHISGGRMPLHSLQTIIIPLNLLRHKLPALFEEVGVAAFIEVFACRASPNADLSAPRPHHIFTSHPQKPPFRGQVYHFDVVSPPNRGFRGELMYLFTFGRSEI